MLCPTHKNSDRLGVLHLWARNAGNSQLAWSTDHGRTWTWSDWKLTTSFGCPTFLNFGKNYAGARDNHVYIYSHDSDNAYALADRMVLARVPADRIKSREAYEFFKNLNPDGQPVWTKDIWQCGGVFENPGGMSGDGKTLHLVFSGDDSFSVRRAVLTLGTHTTGSKNISPK